MRKYFTTMLAVTMLLSQQAFAALSHEQSGDRSPKDPVPAPFAAPYLGEAGPVTVEAGMDAPVAETPAVAVKEKQVRKVNAQHWQRSEKPFKAFRKQHDGSAMGALSLVFGILAFALGWAFWPVGLLFAVLAIVFGAIGLGEGYGGRGMALAGLILGILTIVLPIMIISIFIPFAA